MPRNFQRLYDLGARRVIVTGTGPLGCVPAELALRSRDGSCAAELMKAADLFNPQLVHIVRDLNSQIGSDVFTVANAQRMHFDYISNPQAYGNCIKLLLQQIFIALNDGEPPGRHYRFHIVPAD